MNASKCDGLVRSVTPRPLVNVVSSAKLPSSLSTRRSVSVWASQSVSQPANQMVSRGC